EHVPRGRGKGDVDGDEVGFAEEIFKIGVGVAAGGGEDAHVETRGGLGDGGGEGGSAGGGGGFGGGGGAGGLGGGPARPGGGWGRSGRLRRCGVRRPAGAPR